MSQDRHRREIVEHTTPVWRVLGVGLTAGAIVVLGFYLEQVGFADEFSTVAAVAVLFTLKFYVHKRPDRVRLRAGPFGKVADALRESLDDINEWVLERPLRVGFVIAVFYGIGLVIVKSLILVVVTSVYDWRLAAFVGLLIGAAAAAPQLFSAAGQRLSGTSGAAHPASERRDEVEGGFGREIEKGDEARPDENEEAEKNFQRANAGAIGFYDEAGKPVSAEEFEALVSRGERFRDEEDE